MAAAVTKFSLVLAVFTVATSLAAQAQPTGKVYRIGYLSQSSGSGNAYLRPLEAFRHGLLELGWVEGQNVVIEYRFAEGQQDRLPALAEELVRLKVDVIVATPTPAAVAAKNATRTIPIVGMGLTEPVALGLVASLARPGGNVTGLTYSVDAGIFAKQLELLKEAVPKIRKVAVLLNPGNSPALPLTISSVKTAAASLGLQLQLLEVRAPREFDNAFAMIAKERTEALLVTGDPMLLINRTRLADLAKKNRVPSMSTQGQWVEAGGLMSYGTSLPDLWRRAATYVDKILKGTRPADLPVEQPTKFELVLNLATAKSLGITFPQSLRLRADEVIQ
jgi:putative ABC transport system substrate-binding protein